MGAVISGPGLIAIHASNMPSMDALAPGGAQPPTSGPRDTANSHASRPWPEGAALPPPTAYGPYGETAPYLGGPRPPRRQWFPVAVVAAILIAGALIAAAIFFKGAGTSPTPATVAPTAQPPTAQLSPTSAGRAKTCFAWSIAKADLGQVPRLPSGWTYETPGIDQMIASRAAIIDKILKTFASQISPEPVDVAVAAHQFIDKQGAEVTKLPAHTLNAADINAIADATAALNRACGVE